MTTKKKGIARLVQNTLWDYWQSVKAVKVDEKRRRRIKRFI